VNCDGEGFAFVGAPVAEKVALPTGVIPGAGKPLAAGAAPVLSGGVTEAALLEEVVRASLGLGGALALGVEVAGLVLKPEDRVRPFCLAHVAASMPLGQQKPSVKQKESDGQGSGDVLGDNWVGPGIVKIHTASSTAAFSSVRVKACFAAVAARYVRAAKGSCAS